MNLNIIAMKTTNDSFQKNITNQLVAILKESRDDFRG
jgi:hypothetical protein